jgi:RNA polymerase sigma-70 factor (ECF subfamily)
MSSARDTEVSTSAQGNWFTTTHWSLVLSAQDTSSPLAAAALEKLCRAYWYPLYVYCLVLSIDDTFCLEK